MPLTRCFCAEFESLSTYSSESKEFCSPRHLLFGASFPLKRGGRSEKFILRIFASLFVRRPFVFFLPFNYILMTCQRRSSVWCLNLAIVSLSDCCALPCAFFVVRVALFHALFHFLLLLSLSFLLADNLLSSLMRLIGLQANVSFFFSWIFSPFPFSSLLFFHLLLLLVGFQGCNLMLNSEPRCVFANTISGTFLPFPVSFPSSRRGSDCLYSFCVSISLWLALLLLCSWLSVISFFLRTVFLFPKRCLTICCYFSFCSRFEPKIKKMQRYRLSV